MTFRFALLLSATALGLTLTQASAQFIISQNNTNALFAPSFRDVSGNNANNSTWFGWGYGDFDGDLNSTSAYRLLDGAEPTVGAFESLLAGSLNQLNDYNILASSNNIYPTSSKFPQGVVNETVTIHIPINVASGDIGTGFTTIIIQGNTTSSAYGSNPPNFLALDDYPEAVNINSVVGTNIGTIVPNEANGFAGIGKGQFWVKYEIEGSAASFDINFLAGLSGSIAGLTVDTYWSPTGFAPDYALATPVPEPTATALLAAAAVVFLIRKRGQSARSA